MEKFKIMGYDNFVAENEEAQEVENVNESEVKPVNEGKIKEIYTIAQDSRDVEDFKRNLKEYLKTTAPKLAADKKFIDSMAKSFQNGEMKMEGDEEE